MNWLAGLLKHQRPKERRTIADWVWLNYCKNHGVNGSIRLTKKNRKGCVVDVELCRVWNPSITKMICLLEIHSANPKENQRDKTTAFGPVGSAPVFPVRHCMLLEDKVVWFEMIIDWSKVVYAVRNGHCLQKLNVFWVFCTHYYQRICCCKTLFRDSPHSRCVRAYLILPHNKQCILFKRLIPSRQTKMAPGMVMIVRTMMMMMMMFPFQLVWC